MSLNRRKNLRRFILPNQNHVIWLLVFGSLSDSHSQDDGRGRLIPELSVEQYGTAMGRWFGLSLAECNEIYPNLNLMDPSALDGLMLNV
ncbi:hypothetical protein OAM69_07975 [bacterium]|nr:hypothetical protein [bacterium]